MAINKTVNKSTKSHGGMRNCIEYVLQGSKTQSNLIYVTGPFIEEQINYDSVYNVFLEEKKLWKKDFGRMYNHNIISWHKDEQISLKEAFEFGKAFAENWFKGFQTLIGVHKDREHVHVHLVTNTVSYEDGHKLHNTRKELEEMKQLTNQMCVERGLTVAQKGKDFYGQKLDEGHVRAWGKDKYHLLQNEAKDSYVVECALAVLETKEQSCNKEEFIEGMNRRGWQVTWTPKRKNITFTNEEGKKVRDTNISKTFNMTITKEALIDEFERQASKRASERINERINERRKRTYNRDEGSVRERDGDAEFEQYYREVQSAIAGAVERNTGLTEAIGDAREEKSRIESERTERKESEETSRDKVRRGYSR